MRKVQIAQQGLALHWDALDVHLTVPGLAKGIYGTRAWMRTIGRKGGLATSAEKRRAAHENGRKGGRPRKRPVATESTRPRATRAASKADLVARIAADTGMNRDSVAVVVDELLDHVLDAVADGERVTLGGFGTFEKRADRDAGGPYADGATRTAASRAELTFLPSTGATGRSPKKR